MKYGMKGIWKVHSFARHHNLHCLLRCMYSIFVFPIVISFIWVSYQNNYLPTDMCMLCLFHSFLSCRPCSLAVLSSLYALMIRLLPFLRLSLMRQKATWGMTGPTWLTLAALASAISFFFAENRRQLITVKKSSMGHSLFYLFIFFIKKRVIQCCSLKLGGAEMLSGQLLVSLVYCHIIITVLWLCFGNRQLMKTFGTTCHADA